VWNFQILIVSAVRICKQCLQTASANPLPGLYPWTPLSPRFPGAIAPMKIPGATTVNLVHIPLQCLVKPCFQWPRNSNAFQAKLNYKPLNVGILAYSRQIWYRHILYINETWWQLWYMFASFFVNGVSVKCSSLMVSPKIHKGQNNATVTYGEIPVLSRLTMVKTTRSFYQLYQWHRST